METKNVETKQVYFGKGEYAITNDNFAKLTAAVEKYKLDGGWKWALQDCLGIKMDGSLGRRFGDILATENVPEELKMAMIEVKPRPAEEVYRIHASRGAGDPISIEKRKEVAEALREAGWLEEDIRKVIK